MMKKVLLVLELIIEMLLENEFEIWKKQTLNLSVVQIVLSLVLVTLVLLVSTCWLSISLNSKSLDGIFSTLVSIFTATCSFSCSSSFWFCIYCFLLDISQHPTRISVCSCVYSATLYKILYEETFFFLHSKKKQQQQHHITNIYSVFTYFSGSFLLSRCISWPSLVFFFFSSSSSLF